ncbi:biotin/lipoyl-binding carrier protein [Saccharopolyspora erythraea]|uniref:biotin/lipoyl-binding carrier protein n=1 Tax=Saccharopolyspora erythraea TaxID=1836 RepID=UPI001BA66F20|nr:biotin/lipoyl-binding carrier protein [Saccharopolyspora erythraea]QUH04828.1 biotin/lipoyl-binding carrier protein [Saccharopolyspora erythraea]
MAERDEIRADVAAGVKAVRVAEGDHVSGGDALVVLESMKTEIPVLTQAAGVVSRLVVRPGDAVQEGDLIAVVEG